MSELNYINETVVPRMPKSVSDEQLFVFVPVGNDIIAGGTSEDIIQFTNAFNAQEYTISQNNNDMVISYQQTGMSTEHTLVLSDWYASGNHIENVEFSNGSFSIADGSFKKQAAV